MPVVRPNLSVVECWAGWSALPDLKNGVSSIFYETWGDSFLEKYLPEKCEDPSSASSEST